MAAQILDGKQIADVIQKELKETIIKENLFPALAVILVGDDPASSLYVSLKEKAAKEVGIAVQRYDFPKDTDEATIVAKVKTLNVDEKVHAILVQLPLPTQINPNVVIDEISPEKDADGFNRHNSGTVIPPTIAGSLILLNKTGDIAGKHAVVVGNSKVFTENFCDALRERDVKAEPTYPENTELMKTADILVVAVGKPDFVTPDMVKPGAIVIDVGTNRVGNETVGDVAPEVTEVASYITPVPGGVGPMTVAMLLRNTVELCRLNRLAESERDDVSDGEND